MIVAGPESSGLKSPPRSPEHGGSGKEKGRIAQKMESMRNRVSSRINKLLRRNNESGQKGLQELATGQLSQEKTNSRLSKNWEDTRARMKKLRESIQGTPEDRQKRKEERQERWKGRKEAFDKEKEEFKVKFGEKRDELYVNHIKNQRERMLNRERKREQKNVDTVFKTMTKGELDSDKYRGSEAWKKTTERRLKFIGRRKLTAEAQAWAMSDEHKDEVKAKYDSYTRGRPLSGRQKFKEMANAIYDSRMQAGADLKYNIKDINNSAKFQQAVKDEVSRQMLESGKKLPKRKEIALKRELLTKAVNGEPYTAADIKAQADKEKSAIMSRPEYSGTFAAEYKKLSSDGKPLTSAQLDQAERNAIDSIKQQDAAKRKADEEAVRASGKFNEKLIEMRSSSDPAVRNDPKLQERAMDTAINELRNAREAKAAESTADTGVSNARQQYEDKLKEIDANFNAGKITASERDQQYIDAHSEWKTAEATASTSTESPTEAYQRQRQDIQDRYHRGEMSAKDAMNELNRIHQEFVAATAGKTPEATAEDPHETLLEGFGLDMDSPATKQLLNDMQTNPLIANAVAEIAKNRQAALDADGDNTAAVANTKNKFWTYLIGALMGAGFTAAGALALAGQVGKVTENAA